MVGSYQADAMQGFQIGAKKSGNQLYGRYAAAGVGDNQFPGAGLYSSAQGHAEAVVPVSDGMHGDVRVSSETRGAATRVAAVILV